ncbi:MAG TPA: pilus assembly protein PilM [Candidatus Binatia bacterium]|nr:pilus assembly protein PilM [Candidatus Binatia bacterium]
MERHAARSWWSRIADRPIRGPHALGRAAGLVMPGWNGLVGVDVSETSVKLVRFRGRGGSRSVDVVARALRPDDRGSRIRPADALRELVQATGWQGAPAATAIGGSDIVVRRITLPEMKGADLLSALRLECRKHASGPIEESEIRYDILGRTARDGAASLDLLVTVAPRRRVAEARDLLDQAGLKPVCVTLRSVALLALVDGSVDSEEVTAYLDLGGAASHVAILKGREIRFARDLGVGGDSFTDALRSIVVPGQGTVDLTAEEAEALKRTHGIPFGAEETGTAGRIPLTAVSVMLRPVLERLVRELWNSFDYVNEQFQGESVSRVVLLGDGARVRNLAEYLTGVLKIPVARADAAEKGEGSEAAPTSEMGQGLASLRRGAMNFLAPPEAGTAYRLASAVPQRAAAAIAAVLLLSVSLPAEVAVMGERQRVASLRGSLEEVRPRAEALRRFRAAREEETRLHDLLARLSGGQVLWSYVLRDLSWRVGDDARLTTLEVSEPAPAAGAAQPAGESGREVRLSGLLRTDRERPEKVLGELMDSLSRSPVFDQVRLEGCQTVTPALSSFTVTVRIAE